MTGVQTCALPISARMNAGCGDIQLFDENSREGAAVYSDMNQGENVIKKAMKSQWNSMLNEREDDVDN